jgi:hypothetical protein
MMWARTVAWALAAVSAGATTLAAQAATGAGRRCNWDYTGERSFSAKDPVTTKYNTFLAGGVLFTCRGQDITIRADSAELYDPSGLYLLIGNVRYQEPRITIDAARATYTLIDEKLVAEQNVHARSTNGSEMRGPRAIYYRAVAGVRDVSRMDADGRPLFTFIEVDSMGRKSDPVTLLALRVTSIGDSLFHAGGQVEITRPDMIALADSAFMNNELEFARLMQNPRIVSRGERPFNLAGRVIDLFSRDEKLERVIAVDSAHARSDDLDLVSDTIDLRVEEEELSRAIAWGPSRALATTPERTIEADSLDIYMPGQRLRDVHAIGRAYAETIPDTLKLQSDERDWLRGDTLVASFDSVATADTSKSPPLRELFAVGNAASYYQVPSGDGPSAPPSLNYVRGTSITVTFGNGDVQTVTVHEQAAGMFLEPVADTSAARRDTTGRDSTTPPPDSTAPPPVKVPPSAPAPSGTPASPSPAMLPASGGRRR